MERSIATIDSDAQLGICYGNKLDMKMRWQSVWRKAKMSATMDLWWGSLKDIEQFSAV